MEYRERDQCPILGESEIKISHAFRTGLRILGTKYCITDEKMFLVTTLMK